MQYFCRNIWQSKCQPQYSKVFIYPRFSDFRLVDKQRKSKEGEFLDETTEDEEDQVEYLDEEYEEDNPKDKNWCAINAANLACKIFLQSLKSQLGCHKILNEEYNSQIEKIASMIAEDEISLDEHDDTKLQKYYNFVKTHFNMVGEPAVQLVNEAFLYLKLKNSDSIDPLQHGDEFGAGFS